MVVVVSRSWLLVVCTLTLLGELLAIITLILEYRYCTLTLLEELLAIITLILEYRYYHSSSSHTRVEVLYPHPPGGATGTGHHYLHTIVQYSTVQYSSSTYTIVQILVLLIVSY